MHTLTTFRAVPPFAVGHVRELRVRWALEEAGIPFDMRLIGREDLSTPDYRKQQPFGQVPVLQDGDFPLFESGAILFHLGEKSELLMPTDPAGRSQTVMWMFAALNSVEPHIGNLADLLGFSAGEAWAKERRPALEKKALSRLHDLDAWLVGRDYLVGRFTVADILMTTVLRLLEETDLVQRYATLAAYKERCTSRPAFKKALADHTALYAQAA